MDSVNSHIIISKLVSQENITVEIFGSLVSDIRIAGGYGNLF